VKNRHTNINPVTTRQSKKTIKNASSAVGIAAPTRMLAIIPNTAINFWLSSRFCHFAGRSIRRCKDVVKRFSPMNSGTRNEITACQKKTSRIVSATATPPTRNTSGCQGGDHNTLVIYASYMPKSRLAKYRVRKVNGRKFEMMKDDRRRVCRQ